MYSLHNIIVISNLIGSLHRRYLVNKPLSVDNSRGGKIVQKWTVDQEAKRRGQLWNFEGVAWYLLSDLYHVMCFYQ